MFVIFMPSSCIVRADFTLICLCQKVYVPAVLGLSPLQAIPHSNTSLWYSGKVAFTLTPNKLAELWIVPVGFVVVSVVSAVVAWLMGTIFRLSKSQRAFAIACAMFMNS